MLSIVGVLFISPVYWFSMVSVLLAVLCCVLVGIIFYLLTQKKTTQDPALLEWVKSTQLQMQQLQQTLLDSSRVSTAQISSTMQQQTRDIHERLTKASDIIGELKREAGQFSEISRSMKDLDALLKSPKLRGNLGERVLSDLISQVFPKQHFFLQHRFKSGSIVDAAIQTDAGILPIDSKFPMEHFQAMLKGETQLDREASKKEFVRDVKRHIDAIATKYILPEEGTMDFALMYVPSETVFYEIAANDTLLEYARNHRVYPVSPTTMYAHLQTILLSFEGKKMEGKTKEAFKILRGVQKDFVHFEQQYQTMGKHLTNASNMYVTSSQTLSVLGRGLTNMRQLSGEAKESARLAAVTEEEL